MEELVRAAQDDLDSPRRPSVRENTADPGELTERPEYVSYILMAPGYRSWEFRVGVAEGELRIETPDFFISRPLRCEVEKESLTTRYINGVLSVRLMKSE